MIITGFAAGYPLMVNAKIHNKSANVDTTQDLAVIGEGSYAASTLLDYRKYDPLNTPLDKACYLVYEAKKFSETTPSVGDLTRIKVHYPFADPGKNIHQWRDLEPDDIKTLEKHRRSYFVRQVKAITPLRMESAALLQDLPLNKCDLSPEPPFQGSPKGPGES